MKEKTIKWLQHHIDEIESNMLGMKMSEEDYELNQKDIDELKKCIKWLKGK